MKEINLKGLNETIYYDECSSGLKVYMWVKKNVSTFYGTLSVRYGSIYNEFRVGSKTYKVPKGVAHFLEHVKFNEDKDTTAHDYFFKTACDTNAFTTFEYTNYQVLGSDDATKNVLHLVDFVQNDYFSKSIINNEKGIIIEEANMGYDDPYTFMLFKHLDNIFNVSLYKYLITGDEEDIKDITLEDVKLVFDTFYHPKNCFLIVTGNFNPYEMMEAINENQRQKTFGKFLEPERIIKKENKKVNKKYEEVECNVSNRKIKIGIKIPRKSLAFDDLHVKLYANIMLKSLFGHTSDFRDMLIKKELINNLNYSCDLFDDYLVIIFIVDSNYPKEIINLFNQRLSDLAVDQKTFNRIKNASIASLILEFEDVELVNIIIQNDVLNYGDVIDNIKEIYENMSYSDLNKFINELNLNERSILILNPKDKDKESK